MLLHDSFQADESQSFRISSSNDPESMPSFSRFTLFNKVDNIDGRSNILTFSSTKTFPLLFDLPFSGRFFSGFVNVDKILPNPSLTCPDLTDHLSPDYRHKTHRPNLHHSHLLSNDLSACQSFSI